MGHSNGARRLATSLCVVADLSATSDNEWGVLPTKHTHISKELPKMQIADETNLNLFLGRKQRKRLGTLQVIRDLLEQERAQVERRVQRRYKSDSNVLGGQGQVNTYYDPFRREWRIWYTNSELQNVFAAA
jgi:hypothetical protein